MKLKVFICDGFVSAAKEYRDEGVEFYCTKGIHATRQETSLSYKLVSHFYFNLILSK